MRRARRPASRRAAVDLALHIGEVLYGNVGASDRLDFTVIGPAINEVARIEALCEPLGRPVLVSAEFAAAADGLRRPPRAARPAHAARRAGAEGDFRDKMSCGRTGGLDAQRRSAAAERRVWRIQTRDIPVLGRTGNFSVP